MLDILFILFGLTFIVFILGGFHLTDWRHITDIDPIERFNKKVSIILFSVMGVCIILIIIVKAII